MSGVWRHLTHPDGMTVSLLVTATGLSKEQVRAELRALEQDGKAWRERAPIGSVSMPSSGWIAARLPRARGITTKARSTFTGCRILPSPACRPSLLR